MLRSQRSRSSDHPALRCVIRRHHMRFITPSLRRYVPSLRIRRNICHNCGQFHCAFLFHFDLQFLLSHFTCTFVGLPALNTAEPDALILFLGALRACLGPSWIRALLHAVPHGLLFASQVRAVVKIMTSSLLCGADMRLTIKGRSSAMFLDSWCSGAMATWTCDDQRFACFIQFSVFMNGCSFRNIFLFPETAFLDLSAGESRPILPFPLRGPIPSL
jgi:hypothetical protein